MIRKSKKNGLMRSKLTWFRQYLHLIYNLSLQRLSNRQYEELVAIKLTTTSSDRRQTCERDTCVRTSFFTFQLITTKYHNLCSFGGDLTIYGDIDDSQ